MISWDEIHTAYDMACGEQPSSHVMKTFLDNYPEFAIDIIEVTFIKLETKWLLDNMPEPLETPEWTEFLANLRKHVADRINLELHEKEENL